MTHSIYILIIAALLDYLIGDPWNWPHPVQVMGWVISRLSKFSLQLCQNSLMQRLAGILLGIILIIGYWSLLIYIRQRTNNKACQNETNYQRTL